MIYFSVYRDIYFLTCYQQNRWNRWQNTNLRLRKPEQYYTYPVYKTELISKNSKQIFASHLNCPSEKNMLLRIHELFLCETTSSLWCKRASTMARKPQIVWNGKHKLGWKMTYNQNLKIVNRYSATEVTGATAMYQLVWRLVCKR